MKIAPAYSLLVASLCVLPSSAARGRSLVRGVTAHSNRVLQEGDGPESKGGKKESPLAPKKRDCKLRQEGENEVTFKCSTKTDDAEAKIKYDIDYTVGTSEKGVTVKIKYEQKIDVEDGDKADKGDKGSDKKGTDKEGEEPEDPPGGDEIAEPPADEQIAEPPVEGDAAETPVEGDTAETPVEGETVDPPVEGETVDPPVEGDTAETPVEGETAETPVEGETAETPVEGETAETPVEGETVDPPADEVAPEGQSPESQRALAEQETRTQFEVVYDSIIEYKKGKNSTGEAYDWENDVVLQTISLSTWNVLSEIASNNQSSSFNATSPDGSITFTFTLNQAAIGESASANKMKIDFELKGFPWTSDDSFVALLSTVETERKVDIKYKKGPGAETKTTEAEDVFIAFDDVADTRSYTPFGEYSWAETAEATSRAGSSNQTNTVSTNTTAVSQGNETMVARSADVTQTIKVVATSPVVERSDRRAQEGKQIESIAYSFVGGDAAHRASIIYWDPSAGVDYNSSARPVSLAIAGAGVLFALLALF